MSIADILLKISRQLFPTGRAFKMPFYGFFEGLEKGLIRSEERLYNDSVSILDSSLPDNSNFGTDDASAWEARLGMIDGTGIDLPDRMLAITRKLQFPGQAKARLSVTWFRSQLQAAGFNVYVYENLDNASPYSIYGDVGELNYIEFGEYEFHETEFGQDYNNKIVNYIEEGADNNFDDGGTFRTSLIIGGPTVGSFGTVNVNRKEEFRQLILKLKGTQYIVYLFINYNY
jgi:hypothetical protein